MWHRVEIFHNRVENYQHRALNTGSEMTAPVSTTVSVNTGSVPRGSLTYLGGDVWVCRLCAVFVTSKSDTGCVSTGSQQAKQPGLSNMRRGKGALKCQLTQITKIIIFPPCMEWWVSVMCSGLEDESVFVTLWFMLLGVQCRLPAVKSFITCFLTALQYMCIIFVISGLNCLLVVVQLSHYDCTGSRTLQSTDCDGASQQESSNRRTIQWGADSPHLWSFECFKQNVKLCAVFVPQHYHTHTDTHTTVNKKDLCLPIPAWPTIHDMRMKSITPQMFNMQRTCRQEELLLWLHRLANTNMNSV